MARSQVSQQMAWQSCKRLEGQIQNGGCCGRE